MKTSSQTQWLACTPGRAISAGHVRRNVEAHDIDLATFMLQCRVAHQSFLPVPFVGQCVSVNGRVSTELGTHGDAAQLHMTSIWLLSCYSAELHTNLSCPSHWRVNVSVLVVLLRGHSLATGLHAEAAVVHPEEVHALVVAAL